jgi:hypothetical protein
MADQTPGKGECIWENVGIFIQTSTHFEIEYRYMQYTFRYKLN